MYQETEVSDMKWLSFDECTKYIRPYNVEKVNILTKISNILKNYQLY